MKERDVLLKLMREYFKAPVQVFPGIVKSVDDVKMTCVVEPTDGPELYDVRLKAAIDEVKDGAVEFPKENSTVLVGMIGNDANTCYIVACSEVTKVIYFGGENGGLVNWPEVKEELDKNNEILEAILSVITGAPINQPGGAPSALQAALNGAVAGMDVGNFDDKEDEKVLH